MREIRNYVKVKGLEEAYELNQKNNNCIIGGMLWVRTNANSLDTAIDISGLGLDSIEENEEEIKIGAMVTLREIELNDVINKYSHNALRDAVKDIVGVQFRNMATVGGSIWGRFGFSDVLTIFLCMDTYVELYKGGVVSLDDFVNMPKDGDIIVRIIIKKKPVNVVYEAVRIQSTDFPVITCALAAADDEYRFAIGARPSAACLVKINNGTENIPEKVANSVTTGSNSRGSAEYRKHLIKVLAEHCLAQIGG